MLRKGSPWAIYFNLCLTIYHLVIITWFHNELLFCLAKYHSSALLEVQFSPLLPVLYSPYRQEVVDCRVTVEAPRVNLPISALTRLGTEVWEFHSVEWCKEIRPCDTTTDIAPDLAQSEGIR